MKFTGTLAIGLIALAAMAFAAPAGASAKAGQEVTAKLTGKAEVPGPGDKNGKGAITVNLKANKERVCFQLEISNLDGAMAGHIHKGGPEDAGPVKVTLFEEETPLDGTGAYEGCVDGVKSKLIKRIGAAPEKFYVNIHNEEFPDGAIRGQLDPTTGGGGGGGGGGGEQLSAKLKGKSEVPGPGDENGKGEAFLSVNPEKGKICWQVSWVKIEAPMAAHIHKGAPDDAGPVKVLLFDETPPTDTAEGCARKLEPKLVEKIAAKPERFYVNVHNEEFPDGAIRGQLAPAL
jgi:hypothetical protein